jgi:hypothetical protein
MAMPAGADRTMSGLPQAGVWPTPPIAPVDVMLGMLLMMRGVLLLSDMVLFLISAWSLTNSYALGFAIQVTSMCRIGAGSESSNCSVLG